MTRNDMDDNFTELTNDELADALAEREDAADPEDTEQDPAELADLDAAELADLDAAERIRSLDGRDFQALVAETLDKAEELDPELTNKDALAEKNKKIDADYELYKKIQADWLQEKRDQRRVAQALKQEALARAEAPAAAADTGIDALDDQAFNTYLSLVANEDQAGLRRFARAQGLGAELLALTATDA